MMLFQSLLVLFLFPILTTVSGTPTLFRRMSGVTYSASKRKGRTFDYVVVGAGLAVVTVSVRLSRDKSETILLIKVGNDDTKLEDRVGKDIIGAVIETSLVVYRFFVTRARTAAERRLEEALRSAELLWTRRGMTPKEQYGTISNLQDGDNSD
ncbi:glucose oxidase [Sanghuangporus baumii]|uniref:Glucose oxidase n=1 Tax=Sanghuangporus baumii TaxID=108892 RepID=A0A9Q5I0N8_SANBA|nr:glucose oxidase [Sanghuangporus baumii]